MSTEKKMSRRDLLKLAGAGSAGLVMSGLPVTVIAQDAVTIKVQAHGLDDNQLLPIADIMTASHPHVSVEWVVLTGIDHEEVAAKILALVAAGESIDVGYAATEATQLFAGQGLAAPLDDRITGDPDQDFWTDYFADVHPSLVEAMMYEGSLYEPPRDFNAANMYFNTNTLAENGFDVPGPNWTKDDFVEIAPRHHQEGRFRQYRCLRLCLDQPPLGQLDALDLCRRRQPLYGGTRPGWRLVLGWLLRRRPGSRGSWRRFPLAHADR